MFNPEDHYQSRGPVHQFGDATECDYKIKNVGWTLGNFCPYHCRHCYSLSARRAGANMTKEIVDRIIEQLYKNGIETINVGGNEPIFTNGPKLEDTLLPYIINRVIELGMEIGVTTSGITLLQLYKNFPEEFKKVNDFDISLDSPFEEEHNKNRGANLYKSAMECLKICQETAKPHGIIMTGMKWNFTQRHIDAMLDLCKKTNSNIRINIFKPMSKAHYENIILPEQLYEGFDYLIKNCETLDMSESILKAASKTPNKSRCPCGRTSFRIHSITPDGKVYISPCVYMHDYKSSLDLLTNELSDIVTSDVFKVFRQRNAHPEKIKGCFGCEMLEICGGGCAARSYLHHAIQTGEKSFIEKDFYCPKDHKISQNFSKTYDEGKEEKLVHIDYLCTWIGKPKA